MMVRYIYGPGKRDFGRQVWYSVAKSLREPDYGYRQGQTLFQKYSKDICRIEEITLDFNKYYAYVLDLEPGDDLKIYTEVTYGLPIDVFLVDEPNFNYYKNGKDFMFYKDYSTLGKKMGKFRIITKNSGRCILILDNTFHPTGKAEPDLYYNQGKAEVSVTIQGSQSTKEHVKRLGEGKSGG